MVKKKGHRDAEKKAALVAKKEAKQEKAAKKRLIKLNGGVLEDDDSSNDSNESDFDTDDDNDDEAFHQLLKNYKQQQQQLDSEDQSFTGTGSRSGSLASSGTKVVVLPKERSFPCARSSVTFTITDDSKKKDAYLFGGEYYDGTNIIVSDQLFKYEFPSSSTSSNGKIAVGQWKQICTATSPPPRCAHAAGYYNKSLYIFGGETSGGTTVSTSSSKKAVSSKGSGEYYHYRDIWKYDTVQQQWHEMKPSVPLAAGKTSMPTPRSGMSMTIWKHYMIIFGGFYEAATQAPPRFFNDVYVSTNRAMDRCSTF
jgi:Kelch motif